MTLGVGDTFKIDFYKVQIHPGERPNVELKSYRWYECVFIFL